MLNVFSSIRKIRNARASASSATSHPACPLQPSPLSRQTPDASARVNYDIPTYIRRGIRLSGIDELR
jgi:hypothetical protein